MRRRAFAAAISATWLAGCLDSVLEAPYVLATGLGEARGVCPSVRATLLVASDQGTWEVDGSGDRHLLLAGPSRAVGSHGNSVYVLAGQSVRWGPWPAPGSTMTVQGELPARGVVDILPWCNGEVLLADASGVSAWDPGTGQTWAFASDLPGIRSLAIGPGETCGTLLALTDSALWSVTSSGHTLLLDGIEAPRAVTRDRQGRAWLVHGRPAVLSVLDAGRLQTMARHLGDPRDAQFGSGGLLAPQNVYLADGEGTLDYARVAAP